MPRAHPTCVGPAHRWSGGAPFAALSCPRHSIGNEGMLRLRAESSPRVASPPAGYLRAAHRCRHRNEVFDRALALVPRDGLVCEFGVFEGASTNYLARRLPGRRLFGFDSFRGLPEAWRPDFGAGAFSTGGRLPRVESNVTLVEGWFEDTLPPFVAGHSGPVALLHIDCDL